jgi:hypothetical protein
MAEERGTETPRWKWYYGLNVALGAGLLIYPVVWKWLLGEPSEWYYLQPYLWLLVAFFANLVVIEIHYWRCIDA